MKRIAIFLKENFRKFDLQIQAIVKKSFKIYFMILFISISMLFTYIVFQNPLLYWIGISILKSVLFFIAFTIMYSFAFDKILKQL